MRVETSEHLQKWLRSSGYDALADLPAFEVDEAEYHRHLDEVRAQGLHDDEGENQARALYRSLTATGKPVEHRPAAAESIAKIVDDSARQFRQAVAVLAGKTEIIKKSIEESAAAADKRAGERQDKMIARLHEHSDEHAKASAALLQFAGQGQAESLRWHKAIVVLLALALLTLMMLLGLAVKGHAQDGRPLNGFSLPLSRATLEPAPNLVVPESVKLRIRNIQYDQDKALIRIQNLQLQEQKANEDVQAKGREIQSIVYQLALDNHIDLVKWALDLDALAWRSKEK